MVKKQQRKKKLVLPIVSVFAVFILRNNPELGFTRVKNPEPTDLSHCCPTSLASKASSTTADRAAVLAFTLKYPFAPVAVF